MYGGFQLSCRNNLAPNVIEKYNLTVSLHTPYCTDAWVESTSDEARRAKRYIK